MGDFYVFLFCYILKTFLIFFFVKKYFINYCIAYKKLGDYRKKIKVKYECRIFGNKMNNYFFIYYYKKNFFLLIYNITIIIIILVLNFYIIIKSLYGENNKKFFSLFHFISLFIRLFLNYK